MGDNFNIYEGKPQVSIPDQVRTLVTESKKVFSGVDFEPGQNALEEMLELGNEPGVSSAVHALGECPAKVAIKIETLVYPDGANEELESDAFLNSTETKILPTETEKAFETETVEQHNVEQSIGSNYSEGSDWSCSSSSSQQAEREDHGEHIELQAQASTSETGHGGVDTRRRKTSPQQDDGNRKKKHRATKTFTPAELKDEEYWERRKKNNEAARRSRKLKKLNVSRTRLNELIQQNEKLMEQVLSSRTAIEAFKNNILSVGLDLKNL